METLNQNINKRLYSVPRVICIEIDKQIALQLESSPPIGPDELVQNNSQFNNPFKTNVG
jgi:hypothetical protein